VKRDQRRMALSLGAMGFCLWIGAIPDALAKCFTVSGYTFYDNREGTGYHPGPEGHGPPDGPTQAEIAVQAARESLSAAGSRIPNSLLGQHPCARALYAIPVRN